MGRWCVTVSACCGAQLQQRPRESFGGCTRQDRLPPRSPNLLHSPTKNVRFMAGLNSGQLTEEGRCLGRPTTSQFPSKHHQPRPASGAYQLWIRALFLPPGNRERRAMSVGSAWTSSPIATQCGDQRRVNRQLGTPEQRKPICDNSNRRASPGLGAAKSKSRTMTFFFLQKNE